MTWTDAKRDAERLIAALPSHIPLNETAVFLAIYTTQDELDLMQPSNTWPLAYHRQVIRAAARLLRQRGAKSFLTTVTLAKYQDWLGDRDNTPEMRAQYLAELR